MNKEIKLTFDLSNPQDATDYLAIEALPKTHQAILKFKEYLQSLCDERDIGEEIIKTSPLRILNMYSEIFSQHGITV